jgi:hypothetical protein
MWEMNFCDAVFQTFNAVPRAKSYQRLWRQISMGLPSRTKTYYISASSVLPEVKAVISLSFGSRAWIFRFLLEILVKTRPLN